MALVPPAPAATASNLSLFTEEQFLLLGLELRNNGRSDRWKKLSRSSKINDFRSVYGPHPGAVSAIWRDLHGLDQYRISDDVTPSEFLVIYRWFKSYESANELKTNYGIPVKKIRILQREVPYKIAALRKLKIDPNWEDDDDLVLALTVDGIHYTIDEPRPFSTKYSSHKEGGNACLVYEYGLFTHKQKIAWINGPFRAATTDRDVFKAGLMNAIRTKQAEKDNNFRAIVDDGYFALEMLDVCAFRNELDPSEVAWFKDRALSRQEKFNGLTKV